MKLKVYNWKNLIWGIIGLAIFAFILFDMIQSGRTSLLRIAIVVGIVIFAVPQILSAFSNEEEEYNGSIEERLKKAEESEKFYTINNVVSVVLQTIGLIVFCIIKNWTVLLFVLPLSLHTAITYIIQVIYSGYIMGKVIKNSKDK